MCCSIEAVVLPSFSIQTVLPNLAMATLKARNLCCMHFVVITCLPPELLTLGLPSNKRKDFSEPRR
jgi:hypothetical protein